MKRRQPSKAAIEAAREDAPPRALRFSDLGLKQEDVDKLADAVERDIKAGLGTYELWRKKR